MWTIARTFLLLRVLALKPGLRHRARVALFEPRQPVGGRSVVRWGTAALAAKPDNNTQAADIAQADYLEGGNALDALFS